MNNLLRKGQEVSVWKPFETTYFVYSWINKTKATVTVTKEKKEKINKEFRWIDSREALDGARARSPAMIN